MSDIKDWSTSAASNNAAPPNGWPEGQAPSSINNSARENMAAVRAFYANVEWREFADATGVNDCHTATFATATTFALASGDGDVTAIYHAGRRIRVVSVTPGTIYGTIVSSTGNPTTVTVNWDGTEMTSEAITVSLGIGVTGFPVAQQRGGWEHVNTLALSADAQFYAYHNTVSTTASGTSFIVNWNYLLLFDSVFGTTDNLLSAEWYEGAYRTTNYAVSGWKTSPAIAAVSDVPNVNDVAGGFYGGTQNFGWSGSYLMQHMASTSRESFTTMEGIGFPSGISERAYRLYTRPTGSGFLNATEHVKVAPDTSGTLTGNVTLLRRYVG